VALCLVTGRRAVPRRVVGETVEKDILVAMHTVPRALRQRRAECAGAIMWAGWPGTSVALATDANTGRLLADGRLAGGGSRSSRGAGDGSIHQSDGDGGTSFAAIWMEPACPCRRSGWSRDGIRRPRCPRLPEGKWPQPKRVRAWADSTVDAATNSDRSAGIGRNGYGCNGSVHRHRRDGGSPPAPGR
jgi:hypothetical protein